MMLLLLFIGTIILNVVINLLAEDMTVWFTSAAEWCVRRYAAKWPAQHAARITEECLADLADTRGLLHTVKFVVGLWRPGTLPVETASMADTSQKGDPTAVVIEVKTGTLTTPGLLPTLEANLGEMIRLGDNERPRRGGDITVGLTGVQASTGVGFLSSGGDAGSSSSGGGTPLTWQNSSMFDSANMAIRHGYQRRDVQTRLAMSSSSSNLLIP